MLTKSHLIIESAALREALVALFYLKRFKQFSSISQAILRMLSRFAAFRATFSVLSSHFIVSHAVQNIGLL